MAISPAASLVRGLNLRARAKRIETVYFPCDPVMLAPIRDSQIDAGWREMPGLNI
jgi:hypothetical protein